MLNINLRINYFSIFKKNFFIEIIMLFCLELLKSTQFLTV